MRVSATALPALLAAMASGCQPAGGLPAPSCTSDQQCNAGQLCFAEGCGDPGTGIVVEVSGDALSSQYPQDFPILDGTLGATRDFDLGGPLALGGSFRQESAATPDPATRVAYGAPVVLEAVGKSEYLPDVTRFYEQRIVSSADGVWSMHLGGGRYSVTALPADPAVPPATATDQVVRPGEVTPGIDFVFPALAGTVAVSGRLLDVQDRSVAPVREVAITVGAMDLQAFDPTTLLPLSQRFPVSSGQPGSNGNFAMTLRPEARALQAVMFRATPRDSSAVLPSKDFLVETPLPDPMTLELGGPGDPLALAGRALGPDGLPLANAQVVISGQVMGGGTFRSRVALTDAAGLFTLVTLAGRDLMSLTVVPPPESPAAITTLHLPVILAGGLYPEVTCDRRVTMVGSVVTPSGLPASGVAVRATPHQDPAGEPRPVPLESASAAVDDQGRFRVRLDPGVWRLEFSAPGLPTLSRLITVPAAVTGVGLAVLTRELPDTIRLVPGRTISGTVLGTRGLVGGVGIPWATTRFFRVGPIDGVRTAILLGAAVADDQGRYSLVLPGR